MVGDGLAVYTAEAVGGNSFATLGGKFTGDGSRARDCAIYIRGRHEHSGAFLFFLNIFLRCADRVHTLVVILQCQRKDISFEHWGVAPR